MSFILKALVVVVFTFQFLATILAVEISPENCASPNNADNGVSNVHMYLTQPGFGAISQNKINTGSIAANLTITFFPTLHDLAGIVVHMEGSDSTFCDKSMIANPPLVATFDYLFVGPFPVNTQVTATVLLTVPVALGGIVTTGVVHVQEIDANLVPLFTPPLFCRNFGQVEFGSCPSLLESLLRTLLP